MSHARHRVAETRPATPHVRQPVPFELYLLGLGLVVCIGIAARGFLLGSDRFFYPKEFAFQLFALSAAVAALERAGPLRFTRLDLLLAAFLGWSAIAAIDAPNIWWAYNAVAVSAAGLVVYWVTRSLRDQGYERAVLGIVSIAVVIVALAALLEAYGAFDVSHGNRSPGGVLGNRNQMAHILVLGTPTLLLFAIGVRRRVFVSLTALAIIPITMALVLSRSRGAWLGGFAMLALVVVTLPLSGRALREAVSIRRAALWIGAAGIGILLALQLPNALRWTSKTPYLSSLKALVEYESGSGRGRLLQYSNTIRMIRDHPILGVGPANWSVAYASYAPPHDPSHKPDDVVPVWRYPSGEWIGTVSEVGLPGAAMLLIAGCVFMREAWKRLRRRADSHAVLRGLTLACTLIALGCIGLVDPIIRTPAGGFLVFVVLGVFAPQPDAWLTIRQLGRNRMFRIACLVLGMGMGLALSGRQLAAGLMYGRQATPLQLTRAVAIHPGDYRAHALLAKAWVERDRCDLARPHIDRARRLFPSATLPRRLRMQCMSVLTGGR
ncbi:MAG TPA: O-antigen ligase family protein [Gemmatimonadales bacterium]|nr:O-antigen ligase family protein [Gemmatimonadales bacterium]